VRHCEEIEPLAAVGRANVGRSDATPLRSEPEFGQRSQNVSESVNNDGRHVFQEHELGSNVANDSGDNRPEPSLVFRAELRAGDAERLAGESGSEAMNAATPRAAVEAVKVVPDRRVTKEAFVHSRDQIRGDKGFPLHVADGTVGVAEDELEGKLQSSDAGTKSQPIHGAPAFNQIRSDSSFPMAPARSRANFARTAGRSFVLWRMCSNDARMVSSTSPMAHSACTRAVVPFGRSAIRRTP
jgi:hypothetical protein